MEGSGLSSEVKVVRIIARLNIGGPALHTTHLSAGLADSWPTLLVAGEVDAGEADLYDEAVQRGVNVARVPELGRRLRPWQDLVALFKLVRLLRRTRPQIVHTHTAKAGTLGRVAAVLAGVPVRVHTFHGHVFHGYFGPGATRVFLAVERLLARFTTCVVTVSQSQADELVHTWRICPPEKMRAIPLGLELDRFAPERTAGLRGDLRAELGVGDDEPVVTIVGRLAPIKNHGLLLDAAARLAGQGRAFHLAVVGGGPEEPALRARAAELGIADRVTFLGWRRDLDRVYAGSDVVALTSRNEGTPVALIEALSAGRAVVSTDVGGVRDVLRGGELGLLVPPGDPEALAGALARLLDDPALRESLGRRGAAVAPARYGVGRLLADVRGLYDELLPGPQGITRPLSPQPVTEP
jgi:glycosyltransferase involved in cell wall biosynthesis